MTDVTDVSVSDEDVAKLEEMLAAKAAASPGGPLPSPEPEEAPEAEADEPEPEAKEEQPEEDPERAAALDKARTALARMKVSKAGLAAMSDEDLLEAGRHARELEATSTRNWQALQQQAKKEADDGPPDPEQGQPWVDPKELAKPFVDEFGEEAAKPVLQLAEMVSALQRELTSQRARELDTAMLEARRQVGERFPDLLDGATWEKVNLELNDLAGLERWRKAYAERGAKAVLPELVERAALAAGLDPKPKAPIADSKQPRQEKDEAVSHGAGGRSGRWSHYSTEQLEVGALKAMLEKDQSKANEMVAVIQARNEKKRSAAQ